jgi:molybdate transport system substrate-binding protein
MQREGGMSISRGTRLAGLGLLALGSLLGLASPAHADYPVAPDVVVFCEPTLQHVVADIGALWRARTGIKVRVFTSPTPALLQQITHHARDDVVIGEGDAEADGAADQHLIKKETVERIWSNHLIAASLSGESDGVKGGSPSADKLAAIAGKEPIAVVDPWAATAGADSQKALQSLGLWQAVSAKSIGVVGTADAVYLLAQGKARLAIVYATDVAADPAFAVLEALPTTGYPPVVYWVAQTEHALSPNTSKFVTFMQSADAQQRARADGLEILP